MISASAISLEVTAIEPYPTSTQSMIPSGAPAFTAASRTILAASTVDLWALGCGLMMIPFLVFRQIRVLKIAVEVGLVVGITAATSPIGSAIFVIPAELSFSTTPQVTVCLYLL